MRPHGALLLAVLALGALCTTGCGGPKLIVKSGEAPAKVMLRIVEDGAGKRFDRNAKETPIGQTARTNADKPYMLKWRIPKTLLGGRVALRLVYPNGARELEVALAKNRNTTVNEKAPLPVP